MADTSSALTSRRAFDALLSTLDKSTRGLELVSLEAIYPDEFEKFDDPASDGDARSFRLRVRPEIQLDMNFAEVDLEIALGPDYPHTESSLQLSVQLVRGLEHGQLAELEKELRSKIASLVGREMVFDLAQTAQDFLRKYNVDPKKSLHEKMIEQQLRQQEEEELAARAKAKLEREETRRLQQQQEAQTRAERQEERQRRRRLYRSQGLRPRKDPIMSEDLWGSSDEEFSACSGEEEDEDEGTHATLTREVSDASSLAPGRGDSAGVEGEGGGGAEGAAEAKDAGGARSMRWKRMERIEYTPDGVLVMSPELLGKGRFGSVYLAMCESNSPGAHPRPGAFFAIKEMRLRAGGLRQGQIEKIAAEVECQRKVDHPNIVKVFGCDIESGIFRIFLEYVPLGSVANMLRIMTKLEEEVVRIFTRHLLCGVACLHANGIVHR
jgi:hypothetical protein